MAFLHAEGFDGIVTADLPYAYQVAQPTAGRVTVGAYGRDGTSGLRVTPDFASLGVNVGLRTSIVHQFAVYVDATNIDSRHSILTLIDGQLTLVCSLVLALNPDRSFIVGTSGAPSGGISAITVPLGTTAVNKVVLQSWMYIELLATIHASAGTIKLRVNGEQLLDLAGLDTTGHPTFGAPATAYSQVFIGARGGLPPVQFDDWYIADQVADSAGRLSTWLGDRIVECQTVSGDGAHTGMTPTGGTTHYTEVDDPAIDGDTTRVSSDVLGTLDTYTLPPLARVSAVDAVRWQMIARKEGIGTRAIAGVARIAGTDYVNSADQYLASDVYASYDALWPENPAPPGTNAWTVPDVDNAEQGVVITV